MAEWRGQGIECDAGGEGWGEPQQHVRRLQRKADEPAFQKNAAVPGPFEQPVPQERAHRIQDPAGGGGVQPVAPEVVRQAALGEACCHPAGGTLPFDNADPQTGVRLEKGERSPEACGAAAQDQHFPDSTQTAALAGRIWER